MLGSSRGSLTTNSHLGAFVASSWPRVARDSRLKGISVQIPSYLFPTFRDSFFATLTTLYPQFGSVFWAADTPTKLKADFCIWQGHWKRPESPPRSCSETQARDPQVCLQVLRLGILHTLGRLGSEGACRGGGGVFLGRGSGCGFTLSSLRANRTKRSRAAGKGVDQLRNPAYASRDVGHRLPFHL